MNCFTSDQSKSSKAKPRHDAFEQKNEIARAVEDELEKVKKELAWLTIM